MTKLPFVRLILGSLLLTGGLVTGCRTASPPMAALPTTDSVATRNNCYSLLYQLLEDEKDVSILRFIKREDQPLKELIKKVSATAKAGGKQLEAYAKADATLRLDDILLPVGEVKTRDAIGATKQKELLHTSGDRFELNLLLTQTDALSYGAHLAKVAGLNDANVERARYLAGLSEQLMDLHEAIVARLAITPPGAPVENKFFKPQ